LSEFLNWQNGALSTSMLNKSLTYYVHSDFMSPYTTQNVLISLVHFSICTKPLNILAGTDSEKQTGNIGTDLSLSIVELPVQTMTTQHVPTSLGLYWLHGKWVNLIAVTIDWKVM
jgi:hypothetical protein